MICRHAARNTYLYIYYFYLAIYHARPYNHHSKLLVETALVSLIYSDNCFLSLLFALTNQTYSFKVGADDSVQHSLAVCSVHHYERLYLWREIIMKITYQHDNYITNAKFIHVVTILQSRQPSAIINFTSAELDVAFVQCSCLPEAKKTFDYQNVAFYPNVATMVSDKFLGSNVTDFNLIH